MREFSYPVRIDPWPAGGVAFHVCADRGARRELTRRLGLEALDRFEVAGRLGRADGAWLLEARLRADLVQICVVTLEPFASHLDEPIRLVLRADADADEATLDPEEPDVVPVTGSHVDLGEIFYEELALRLDPHPRAPGASLDALEAPRPPADAPDDDWRARLLRQRQALAS